MRRTKSSIIIILIYVDDILITGSDCVELEKFIKLFSSAFALKNLRRLSYFLGIEVLYDHDSIYLSQKKYIRDLLAKVDMLECKGTDTPMSSSKDYRCRRVLREKWAIILKTPLITEA